MKLLGKMSLGAVIETKTFNVEIISDINTSREKLLTTRITQTLDMNHSTTLQGRFHELQMLMNATICFTPDVRPVLAHAA